MQTVALGRNAVQPGPGAQISGWDACGGAARRPRHDHGPTRRTSTSPPRDRTPSSSHRHMASQPHRQQVPVHVSGPHRNPSADSLARDRSKPRRDAPPPTLENKLGKERTGRQSLKRPAPFRAPPHRPRNRKEGDTIVDGHSGSSGLSTRTLCAQTATQRWTNVVYQVLERTQIPALVHASQDIVNIECATLAQGYALLDSIAGTAWYTTRTDYTGRGTTTTITISHCPVVIRWGQR